MRRLIFATFAALIVAGPVLADVPDDLPGQVAGVIGSGVLLSLKLQPVDGRPVRIVSQGDVFADGWVLSALTPSVATLTKGGMSRQIGLNPGGALAESAPGSGPTQVEIALSTADLALIDAALANGNWNGKPFKGRTLEETRRSVVYTEKIDRASAAKLAATGDGGIDSAGMRAVLGEAAYADFQALARKAPSLRQAAIDSGDVNQVRVLDGLAAIGPDSIYIPPGTSTEAAARAVGLISLAGYTRGTVDASGGRTVTKASGPGQPLVPAN